VRQKIAKSRRLSPPKEREKCEERRKMCEKSGKVAPVLSLIKALWRKSANKILTRQFHPIFRVPIVIRDCLAGPTLAQSAKFRRQRPCLANAVRPFAGDAAVCVSMTISPSKFQKPE
jgi:hypothetical protein